MFHNRFVKSKRPNISPNLNFMGQLLDFEKTLHSLMTSSRMATHPLGSSGPCKSTSNCDQTSSHFSRHHSSCDHECSGCPCIVDSQVGSSGVLSFAS